MTLGGIIVNHLRLSTDSEADVMKNRNHGGRIDGPYRSPDIKMASSTVIFMFQKETELAYS